MSCLDVNGINLYKCNKKLCNLWHECVKNGLRFEIKSELIQNEELRLF